MSGSLNDARVCSCGDRFDAHPMTGCSDAHEPAEFDVFGHAERVAANFPVGSPEHGVALYHDHLEDDLGPIPANVSLRSVRTLTRQPDESYIDYIERVRTSGDPVAITVKLADARDNLARCHGEFDGHVNPGLAARYEYVIKALS